MTSSPAPLPTPTASTTLPMPPMEVSSMSATSVIEPGQPETLLNGAVDELAGAVGQGRAQDRRVERAVQRRALGARPPELASSALQATTASSELGFEIARIGTRFGFGLAKAVVDVGAAIGGAVVDHALGIHDPQAGVAGGPAASNVRSIAAAGLNAVQALSLLGIELGARITGATMTVADVGLSSVYGNREAVRALVQFVAMVSREYNTVLDSDPPGGIAQFPIARVAKAIAAWAVLQTATAPYLDGKRFAPHLTEIDLGKWAQDATHAAQPMGEVHVTGETPVPGDVDAEVITGDVEREPGQSAPVLPSNAPNEDEATRRAFKRYSRISLGAYGGIGLLFFGVPIPPAAAADPEPASEPSPDALAQFEHRLEECEMGEPPDVDLGPDGQPIESPELEPGHMEGEYGFSDPTPEPAPPTGIPASTADPPSVSYLNVLRGRDDLRAMEHMSDLPAGSVLLGVPRQDEDESTVFDVDDPETSTPTTRPPRLQGPPTRRAPRYFVVTDRPARSIVLCVRGTWSLDDLATDLACEEASFASQSANWAPRPGDGPYSVHGGMLEIAEAMGGVRGPVTKAVAKALRANEDFDLVVIGHSLGAGIAGLLTMLWADPDTQLTTNTSGLPPGRKAHAYTFAPPCLASAALGKRVRSLVHSFVLGNDAVCRLSLGHILDLRSAGAWLCASGAEGSSVFSRAKSFRERQYGHLWEEQQDEANYLIAMRTTLEANMHSASLFPAGDVYWLTSDLKLPSDDLLSAGDASGTSSRAESVVSDDDSHHNEPSTAPVPDSPAQPRLFRVTGDVDVVFRQMVMSSSMLSSHLPQRYEKALRAL